MYTAAIIFRDGVTKVFDVAQSEKLLDAAFRNGVSLPLDCREGVCATCRCRCDSGKIEMEYCDEDALSDEEINGGYILSCQTTLQSPASFYFDIDSSICNVESKSVTAEVSQITAIADSAVMMEVTLKEEDKISYLPGQYAHITIPGSDESRAYSFVNAEVENGKVNFLLRLLPDGVMSNYLRDRCQIGDQLQLTLPYGVFYLREIERPLLLIAGGTGLSAILSMLEQLAQMDPAALPPIRMLYGVRREKDLCALSQLETYQKLLPDFQFDVILSEGAKEWSGKRGFVVDHIDLDFIKNPFDLYICGPPGLVSSVESWVALKEEIAPCNIYFERFVAS
ncbi:anthranilate 1,2-dioxygenase electron transfer component AntC [Ignatzschineria cameli]|uniref:Anthranilate 1,2-dioxygenase electron transfer component AntC n=1 Tax=Ignatzschineria cameli TaxID=2182793 RepID=A0A2U2ATU6_9GAMM|nr:anthranilate 1,2-dioxygenase electron transfer component AntC [Ignatzschineria cameli]PWD88152.1 anthranilate 1,2-dioxygenase electron transfer component AntC [Ignatzschineria cameli]PWD91182.1 anthranilate 1,2-dioxygenase electron transfer component AntC [Ignatzschineria cameli]PWD92823.1 anthranilate 1,2-dioxygenase electron transfer component AntC [Ignatzschineria cameli]PWD93844.1 anthranilate 1,2-dioxygenase electron transfer component AntC [Ignatzschineria cameli]